MPSAPQLPEKGFVRLAQLIGQKPVSEAEAKRNRRRRKGPRRAREGVPGLLPVSRSTAWDWIRRRRIPAPCYPFGPRIPCWSVEVVRSLLKVAGQQSVRTEAA
jgi:hypothetical protein